MKPDNYPSYDNKTASQCEDHFKAYGHVGYPSYAKVEYDDRHT